MENISRKRVAMEMEPFGCQAAMMCEIRQAMHVAILSTRGEAAFGLPPPQTMEQKIKEATGDAKTTTMTRSIGP